MTTITQVDLLDLVGRDVPTKRTAATKGGEFHGPCPFCGGRDRFMVWPQHPSGRGEFLCRQCGAKGDAIDYVRKRDHLSYPEAVEHLAMATKAETATRAAAPAAAPTSGFSEPVEPPGPEWQARAWEFVVWAQVQLWSETGAEARGYLYERGLSEATIKASMLGWNPKRWEDKAERWGCDANAKPIHLAAGVVIPTWSASAANPGPWSETLWGARIRRLEADADPKYLAVRGSTPALFGVDGIRPDRPAVLVEGEFDALIIGQAVDSFTAIATGSTSWCRRARWLGLLARARRVAVAFDADQAGESAATWWVEALGAKARRWRPWWGDANDLAKAGANLSAWLAPVES